jgi:uncharacterized protein
LTDRPDVPSADGPDPLKPDVPGSPDPGTQEPDPVDPDPTDSSSAQSPGPTGPPGVSVFSLEGRAAPALYLLGWIGTLMGFAVLFVWVLAASPEPGLAQGALGTVGLALLAIGFLSAAGSQAIERRSREDLDYRGPSPVLAFAAVISLTLLAVVVVIAPLVALGLDVMSPLAALLSMVLTTIVYVVVVWLVVVGPGALSWREMGVTVPGGAAARDFVYGAVWAIPVVLFTGFVAAVLSLFLATPPPVLAPATDPAGILAIVLTAVVLAPVGEELFFRGFATTAWARAIGRNPAIIRGAIFFAIAHIVTVAAGTFQEGLEQAIFASLVRIPVGLALGWVFLARRSLPAAIGLHAGFNALGVLALYLAT